MSAYYNEIDPKAAAWLRELIKANLIAPGEVDERSIVDVRPNDLAGFCQCHFFAGIGGWSYALRLAGWPDDRPVWTGSCPCQPFSCAGKGKGTADERHLWPEFFRLIKACRPVTTIGEQVEGSVKHGWLDGVFADLEGQDYACGAAVLGAHSVGAPHIRQRLYWVADGNSQRFNGEPVRLQQGETRQASFEATRGRADDGVADMQQSGLEGYAGYGDNRDEPGWEFAEKAGAISGLGNTAGDGWDSRRAESGRPERVAADGCWSDSHIIPCRDNKNRRIPVEPAFFPVVNGFSGPRVGILRGAGNAIVPQIAAEFIGAVMDLEEEYA